MNKIILFLLFAILAINFVNAVTPSAYYRLNNTLHDEMGVYDLSGYAGIVNYTTGKLGNASLHNGSIITVATTAGGFNFSTNPFTIALWIKTGIPEQRVMAYTNFSGVSGTGWGIRKLDTGGIRLDFNDGETSPTTGRLDNNIWHRVAFVRRGTGSNQFEIWVDNVLNITTTLNNDFASGMGGFYLGNWVSDSSGLTGTIDDIQIWNGYAWSTSEISTDWSSGNGQEWASESINTIVGLNSPDNATITESNSFIFSANITPVNANLVNSTLYIWFTNNTLFNSTSQILSGSVLNTSNINVTFPIGNFYWNYYGCSIGLGDTTKCSFAGSNRSFSRIAFVENSITYTSSITENQASFIIGNFTFVQTPSSILLLYNNTNSTPNILIQGKNYILTSSVVAPIITSNINISFYYNFIVNGISYNTGFRNQSVINIDLSAVCGAGTYTFLNITNFDEESLAAINGTVEYTMNLQSGSNQLSAINGNATGINIGFCTSQNLSNSYVNYNLQLRYYATGYVYKTYNIQAASTSNIPLVIPLYYLDSSGTQFKIYYTDFNYLTYPGAIIQIQRQYLSGGLYRTVEIPKLDNNGMAIGSFNTNNIRYKIVVINQGVVLDTFDDIFPVCQNVVLGTCELNLRGAKTIPRSTTGDFTYSLVKTNSSIILSFIIPSGTPRTIEFITNQDSRFLNNISICDISVFASGGTITCGYNATIGDSIISTQIINSDGSHLYGSILISEDLSSFYLLNNYFIGFILLLSLGLMFVSSGVFLTLIAVVGLVFLGLIYLIRGMDVITLLGSLGWLVVAAVIIIFKISQKEETS